MNAESLDRKRLLLCLGPKAVPKPGGLEDDLDAAVEAMKSVPSTTLQEMRGNKALLDKIEDAEKLLRSLRFALP